MTSAKKIGTFLLIMAAAVFLAGTAACSKKAEEQANQAESQPSMTEFEGKVQSAYGKYLYLPAARGFDIVTEGFDAASLAGKDVRVKGEMIPDKPSIFEAESIEEKGPAGTYTNVYQRTEPLTLEDFIDVKTREAYTLLTITSANKPEEWEGKGQVKVYGKLEETPAKEGSQEPPAVAIVVSDDSGKEVGRILVDSISNYARYYIQKLRLFDKFYFYIDVKDTVERRDRTRNKNLFHADVKFAGLF